MNVATFIKSDAFFEIGVRCGDPGNHEYRVVIPEMDWPNYAVLSDASQQGELTAIELVHCDAGAHGVVQGNIDRLNAISAQTGFVFSLRPPVAGCERTLAGLAGSLTNPNSKPFDRRIK